MDLCAEALQSDHDATATSQAWDSSSKPIRPHGGYSEYRHSISINQHTDV